MEIFYILKHKNNKSERGIFFSFFLQLQNNKCVFGNLHKILKGNKNRKYTLHSNMSLDTHVLTFLNIFHGSNS